VQNADAYGLALRWSETLMESNDSFTRETVKFWQEHRQCDLTEEDAREAVVNVVGFFTVLDEWKETMGDCGGASSSMSDARRNS
jgi:hypothetical protein